MPQLIAMIIVVVGAMIYMFQTFGGTGDKVEGIAQKTSVITEINNIKNGLQLAVRAGDVSAVATKVTDAQGGETTTISKTTLKALADMEYFADQINKELQNNTITTERTNGGTNTYSAISFGGEDNPGMLVDLVLSSTKPTTSNGETNITQRPGIRVQFTGNLASNGGFLESQIATDLSAVASIDRITTDGSAVALTENGEVDNAYKANAQGGTASGTNLTDGIFTIYFKDIPANVLQ